MRTLVIPDSHDDPEVKKFRYEVVSNCIVDRKPDNIVQIGDFQSLDSISFHNHGRPKLQEGKRLAEDLASGREAYETMMKGLNDIRKKQGRNKKRKYSPNLYWINGNHEYRVSRFLEQQPVIEGLLDPYDLLGVQKDGWTIADYRDYVTIEGTMFTHVPLNPRSGNPIGGQYVALRAAHMSQHTVVFGHTHTRTVMAFTRNDPTIQAGGHRVEGITVGCWLDHWPEYMAHNTRTCDWWEGLTIMNHTGYGRVDPEFYSKKRAYQLWA